MEEHRAIGTFRSAVDIQHRRIFLPGIIILRQKNPTVDLFPIQLRRNRMRLCYIGILQHFRIPRCQAAVFILFRLIKLGQLHVEHSREDDLIPMHIIVADNPVRGSHCLDPAVQAEAFQPASIPVQRGKIEIIALCLCEAGRPVFHICQHRIPQAFIRVGEQLQLPGPDVEGIEAGVSVFSVTFPVRSAHDQRVPDEFDRVNEQFRSQYLLRFSGFQIQAVQAVPVGAAVPEVHTAEVNILPMDAE